MSGTYSSPLRDAPDSALVVAPVETEPEHIHVILGGLLDTANGNLWNRLGKVREHVLQLTPMRHKTKFISRAVSASIVASVLVQREMETWRAPLASIAPIPPGLSALPKGGDGRRRVSD